MEGQIKMKLFVAVMVALMGVSAVQNVAAADAPAPAPTSDASLMIPTLFASAVAMVFGFCF